MAREKFPSDDVDRLMVRFPSGLRDRIKDAAETNGRSMNAEIVASLSAAYPSSTTAAELLNDLWGLIDLRHRKSTKITEEDMALLNETFEGLVQEVRRLQRLDDDMKRKVGTEDPEGAN